jgi:osmotically-inducible protein OsmY
VNDSLLKHNIKSALSWEPRIKEPEAIGVAVREGIVTFSGRVQSYMEKLDAERAATRVYGVKAVVTELEVWLPSFSKRSDEHIAQAAVNALEWATGVPQDKIKVTVEYGWVTLEGAVYWRYQRGAAEDEVQSLTGVRGILNLIVIEEKRRIA